MAGSGTAHLRNGDDIVIRVEDLTVEFPAKGGNSVHAVSGISFDVRRGETLGLVGESGCGKSTTGRALLQLPAPTGGSVQLDGEELTHLSRSEMTARRTDIQMIFQDPISSLNPRRTIGKIVAEPLDVWGPKASDEQWALVASILDAVGIDPECEVQTASRVFRRPMSTNFDCTSACHGTKVIICDEPVSALDVSVQAQILNMLEDLKAKYGLTLVFIAHDLAVVKNISDRVAVMYLGKMCEISDSDDLYAKPAHPYTQLSIRTRSQIQKRSSMRRWCWVARFQVLSSRRQDAVFAHAVNLLTNNAQTRSPKWQKSQTNTTSPVTTR